MSITTLVFIPLIFGLIGFIEPCSLGMNIIFLSYVNKFSKKKRLAETVLFVLVRGFILAIIGLLAAFIGSRFISVQSSLFIVLGIIYILMGIFSIINKYHPLIGEINMAKYVKGRSALSLGVLFGLVIPACAIPLVIALIGVSAVIGNIFQGFISLFIFGVTLSAPLIFIATSEKSNAIIQRLQRKIQGIKWLTGIILIAVGILTLLSSVWWSGVVL